ncbi:hypothetical protein GCM10028804_19210 [Larkinella terrae]
MQVFIQLFLNGGQHARMPVTDVTDADARNKIHVSIGTSIQINPLCPFDFEGQWKVGSLGNVLKKELPIRQK